MGSIFKKIVTKPVPPGAEIVTRNGQRFARWKTRAGKPKTAQLTEAGNRITVKASTFTAKYRDGSGVVREVATGCKDETAARQVLANLEKRADAVRSGIRSAAEDAAVDHQPAPIAEHFGAYRAHQQARGVHPQRIKTNQARLARIAAECGFKTFADLGAAAFERWLTDQKAAGMSAGTRNGFREALIGFCNWCRKPSVGRLLSNPFIDVPKADVKADQRRKRRSMAETELVRLLEVARQRPVVGYFQLAVFRRWHDVFVTTQIRTLKASRCLICIGERPASWLAHSPYKRTKGSGNGWDRNPSSPP